MRSLFQRSAAIAVAGGIALTGLLAGSLRVLALTTEQVVERLRPVPVFAVTDADGTPLVASTGEGEDSSPVAGVFISRQDAQQFLEGLKSRDPNIGNTVQVTTVSLAEIFELAVRQQNVEDALRFYFVPMRQQVESARTVLQQNRQNPENFEGVPLFFLESTQEGGGYLTIQQGNQRVIPIFFTQQDLQAMQTRITQQEPSLSGRTRVQVTSLETLIQILQSSDDPDLNQVVLVPPRETLEYIRTLQPTGQNGSRPGNAPAAQPARGGANR
ncbi:MAG: hypothetical protein Fur0046_37770 [Cyanobacteria bacterium J069]|nr:MAG: hypothetical protein D6742_07050 [Cyanobacteria bacterium J069]